MVGTGVRHHWCWRLTTWMNRFTSRQGREGKYPPSSSRIRSMPAPRLSTGLVLAPVHPHLLGVVQEGEVAIGLGLQLAGQGRLLAGHHRRQFPQPAPALLPLPGAAQAEEGLPGPPHGLPGEPPLQVALPVQQAELVLGIGEELAYHLPQAPEVVGDEEEHPMHPTAHQVLQHLASCGLALPPLKNPEAQHLFEAVQVYAQGHQQGDVLHLAPIDPQLGPVGGGADGEPVGRQGLGLCRPPAAPG